MTPRLPPAPIPRGRRDHHGPVVNGKYVNRTYGPRLELVPDIDDRPQERNEDEDALVAFLDLEGDRYYDTAYAMDVAARYAQALAGLRDLDSEIVTEFLSTFLPATPPTTTGAPQ